MLRLAWCSPFPPERSGIADYSVELIEAVCQLAEVTLFVNDPAAFDAPSLDHLNRYPIELLGKKRFDFDLPIYQMGNHLIHQKIYQQALSNPGIVVLHEFDLHGFMVQNTIVAQRPAAYFREVIYETASADFHQQRTQIYPNPAHLSDNIPMNKRLIDSALAVMVHSQFVADALSKGRSSSPHIKVIRQLGKRPSRIAFDPVDSSKGKIVFACGGQITHEKQIDQVLDAVQQLVKEGIDAHLLLIGESIANIPLKKWIDERQLNEHVTLTGYVETTERFEQHIAQADVVINLRQPTIGETSAVVIRSMALGKPVIVYDHGWYAELPDECCIKIEPGSASGLIAALRLAAADRDRLQVMGNACQAEIDRHYRPEVVAKVMVDWLANIVSGVQQSVCQTVNSRG